MSKKPHKNLTDRRIVPSDEKDFLNIVRDAPRPPPSVGIFDSPVRCYTVNEEWAKHIMGAVSALTLWKAWTGPEDDRNDAVQEVFDFMVGEVCSMFLLRQNPEDSCQLQQSIDGGETWTVAFDYDLCLPSDIVAAAAKFEGGQQFIDDTNDVYLGDITNVAPEWEYGDEGDVNRDNALCWAIRQYVDMICDITASAISESIEDSVGLLKLGETAVGSIFSVMTLASFFPAAAAVGALAVIVAKLLTEAFADEVLIALGVFDDPAPFGDQAARDDVACLMFLALEGQTPTIALWRASAAGSLSGDAETIRVVVEASCDNEDNFVQFLAFVEDMISAASAGAIGNDCTTCGTGGDSGLVDFDDNPDDLDIDSIPRGFIVPSGNPVSIPNVIAHESFSPQATAIDFLIDLGSDKVVIKVSFWRITFNVDPPNNSNKTVQLLNSSRNVEETIAIVDVDPFNEWEEHIVFPTFPTAVRFVRIFLGSSSQGLDLNFFAVDHVEIITE